MTLEYLISLDLKALEDEFGSHIAEEIAQCTDKEALLSLGHLINTRLEELLNKADQEFWEATKEWKSA